MTAPVVTVPAAGGTTRRWTAPFAAAAPFLAWLLLGAGAFAAAHAVAGAWTIDDAEITYNYARSVARGDGFGLSAEGMPVEGFSNPLLLLICAAAARLSLLDSFLFHNVLEPLEFGVLLFVVWRLLRQVHSTDRKLPVLLTAAFGALELATPATLIWYGSGLENLQLTLGIVLLVHCLTGALQGQLHPARDSLVVILLALVRPEAILYAVVAFAGALVHSWRAHLPVERRRFRWHVARTWAVVTAVLLLGLAVRWSVFGSLLPNTFWAKVGPGAAVVPDGENYLRELAIYAGAVAFAVFGLLVPVAPAARGLKMILVLLVPVSFALPAIGGKDWMGEHRFGTAYFALGHLLFVVVLAGARWPFRTIRWPFAALPARHRRLVLTIAAAAIPVAALATMRPRVVRFFSAPAATVDRVLDWQGLVRIDVQRHLGLFEPVVALPDVGGSALAGKMQLIDTLSLTDFHVPRIRTSPPEVYRYQFGERRTDLLVSHGAGTTARWLMGRELLNVAAFPGNPRSYWARRPLVELQELPAGAVALGQRGAVRLWASPNTVWQVGPRGYARVEIILQIDPDAAVAEHPRRDPLVMRLDAPGASDVEELPLLGVTAHSVAPLEMRAGRHYRQAFLLHAPRSPGRYPVVLAAGLSRVPLPIGQVEVIDGNAFDEGRVGAIVGDRSVPLLERARRLAQLAEQLQERRPRAEVSRDLAELRALAATHGWGLMKVVERLSADFMARPAFPGELRRRADALLDEAAEVIAAALRAANDPASSESQAANALLEAGRLADGLRRCGLTGVADRTRSLAASAKRRILQLPSGANRYLALVGLTSLDPRDVTMQRALLKARPHGVDLPYP